MNTHRPIDDIMCGLEEPELSIIPQTDPLWDEYWRSCDVSKLLSLHFLNQGSPYFWLVYKRWHPYPTVVMHIYMSDNVE